MIASCLSIHNHQRVNLMFNNHSKLKENFFFVLYYSKTQMVYSNSYSTRRNRQSDNQSIRCKIKCSWYSLFHTNYTSVCRTSFDFYLSRFFIYFRDQLLYPFKVVDRVNLFDIDINYDGVGFTAQAIAARLAISKALCSFISSKEVEYLRLGKTSLFL